MKKYAALAALVLVIAFFAISIHSHLSELDAANRQVSPKKPADVSLSGKIAYAKYVNGNWSVYVMNADGSGPTHIVDCLALECYPNWSPDGTKFVFQRLENGAGIYVVNANGTGMTRLSPSPAFDLRPSWSPDGKQIVFNRTADPNVSPPATDIMVMNADGSGAHTVLPANGQSNLEPRFSPDGKKIVFMSLPAGNSNSSNHWQIFTINADGSGLTQLTSEAANHGDPVWSPDGSRISFGSDREGGGKLNIFTMKADGSDVQQITHFKPPYEAGDTWWTPDGKYIAFQWDVGGTKQSDPNVRAEVWIVTSDGSREPWSTGVSCASVGCSPRWKP